MFEEHSFNVVELFFLYSLILPPATLSCFKITQQNLIYHLISFSGKTWIFCGPSMNHHKITSLLLAPLNGPLIERRKNSFLTKTLMSTTYASNFEDTMITPQLTPTSVVPILHVLHSDGHQAAPPNNEVQPSVGGKITADQGMVLCSTIQRFADECSPVVQKKRSSDEVVESNTMASERIFHRKCKSSVCPTSSNIYSRLVMFVPPKFSIIDSPSCLIS